VLKKDLFMEKQKKLAKLALAGLLLASALPMGAQAAGSKEIQLAAAGCAAHGCGAGSSNSSSKKASKDLADNADNYPTSTNPGAAQQNYNTNRNYSTSTNYNDSDVNAAANTTTLTKNQLWHQLSPKGKEIFNSLDPQGQTLALQLASKSTYTNKDLAVKEAQRKMNEDRGMMSR
jgi:hypothetical protein